MSGLPRPLPRRAQSEDSDGTPPPPEEYNATTEDFKDNHSNSNTNINKRNSNSNKKLNQNNSNPHTYSHAHARGGSDSSDDAPLPVDSQYTKPLSPRLRNQNVKQNNNNNNNKSHVPPPPPLPNLADTINNVSNGSRNGSRTNTPKTFRIHTPKTGTHSAQNSSDTNSSDHNNITSFGANGANGTYGGAGSNGFPNISNISENEATGAGGRGRAKHQGGVTSKDEFAARVGMQMQPEMEGNGINAYSNPLAVTNFTAPISPLDDVKDEALESVEFTALLRQVDVGLEMTELLKEVIRKFSKHQLADATKLQEIYGKMQNVYLQMDGMQEFADVCNLTHKLILETVQQQKVLAEFLANDLVPKLTQHLQEKQSAVQILKKENQQAELKLQTATTAMKKADNNFRQAAKRARNTADPAPRKKTGGFDSGTKGKKGLKKFAKGIKNKMTQNSTDLTEEEETYIKADRLGLEYEASVMTANHAQDKHLQICRHFKYRLRAIEEARMSYVTNQVKLFIDKHEKYFEYKPIDELRKEINERCDKLDSASDFESWITKHIQTRGKVKPPEKFEAKSYDYENAFYSLEDAMKVTRKVLGASDVQVPLMMTRLCEKVKKTEGFTTEGIFRISASVSDLEYLRKRLYQNDYNIESNDPHVSAGMLKDWLRGLKDSLIPGTYYDACVEMAKQGNIDAERLDVFISQLPEVNRESIRYLVVFLKELLAPENTKVTRMNVENIAIVFAPTVLRCPRDDAQLMLANSKHEQTFMIQLIEKLKY